MPVGCSSSAIGHAVLGEPRRHGVAPTGARHDHIGGQLAAVVEPDAADVERRGRGPRRQQAVDGDADLEPHARLGQRAPPQHPLERGAPAAQHLEVGGVALVARGVGRHDRRHDAHLAHAGLEQGREHVGVAVAQDHPDQRREAVGVAHLRRTPPVPLEGALDVVGHRRVVALDDGDVAPRSRQRDRRGQPADAGAHDDHPRPLPHPAILARSPMR